MAWEAGPGLQLKCWVLAAQPRLWVRSKCEVSVDLQVQCLETGTWAMERMSLCRRESVREDRAAGIRRKVPKLGCTHCCCETNRGVVRGVWPGGGASAGQGECVRVCLLPALLNEHCVIQASSSEEQPRRGLARAHSPPRGTGPWQEQGWISVRL